MYVVATAGHVDHGKSTLVRALTGMEPDRWAEERRRGMTIDLGYAWMTLPAGEKLAFVDVPGHERFVPNMLAGLGPEPLSETFDSAHLWKMSRGRSAPVKAFLMDQKIVVGVGNIYAAEALFAAGIHPNRPAGSVSLARYVCLAVEVKRILEYAITRGGTTLRDFISPDGLPGYFEQDLFVYGRVGQPCKVCGTPIRAITLGQRSTFYCPRCQR